MKKISVVVGIIVVLIFGVAYLNFISDEVIVLGVLGDYSSNESTASVDAYRAANIAISELNVETYKYEIVRLNLVDYSDVDSLKKDISKFNIDIIIGPSTSGQYFIMKDILEKIDLPVFLLAVSTDVIYDKKDNLFRLTDTMHLQIDSIYTACNTYLGLNNIQMFYTEKNAAFSEVFAIDLCNTINGYGGNSKHTIIGDLSKKSVQNILLEKYDAEGFVIIAGPGDAGIIAGLLSKNNPDIPMLMPSWAKSDRTKEYAVDVKNKIYILSTAQPIREDAYNDFELDLRISNDLSVTSFSYFGYEVVYFIDHIFEQINSTELTDIQEYIHNINYYEGNFNDFTFNNSGDGARGYSLMMIDNDQFILIENLVE